MILLACHNYIGTHDIQNISVTSPQPGEVRVTGDFIDGSTATGLLIIIYSANNTEYQLFQVRVKLEAVISGLLGGNYEVSVFVVEENGLPFSRAASKPKQITISSACFNAENSECYAEFKHNIWYYYSLLYP